MTMCAIFIQIRLTVGTTAGVVGTKANIETKNGANRGDGADLKTLLTIECVSLTFEC